MDDSISVIGLGCRFPEADTPADLWENVLSQRRSFRRIPPERIRLEDYYSADRSTPDAFYAEHAALLGDYKFDRVRFRISGKTYRSTDLTHWLALEVAEAALADAGLLSALPVERDRVGVVVGNTLTGDMTRSNTLRLRWPYVRRVLSARLRSEGCDKTFVERFLSDLEPQFKAPFPPLTEDSLSGGLSNTIAGRVCNYFDLGGGGFTVDGACSSSLLAVISGCQALLGGDVDAVLAGGVDISIDPFELVGFAKTGALTADLMRVYDKRSSGFWPGEGCGMAVLVRSRDAQRWGARTYARIGGWGISSDGRGGITRPELAGQLLAMRRAYARAGISPGTVSLFEGHGTGTAVGDATELAAISALLREDSPAPPAAIGSIKANIGHTKAAAGAAGLIKAVLSLHHQVLPPTTGCDSPHDLLAEAGSPLRVLRQPEEWPADRPLRASVCALGFGGINAHLALESQPGQRRAALSARQRRLATTAQDCELIPLAGADLAELSQQAQRLREIASWMSFGQLRDLAIEQAGTLPVSMPVRAAIIAGTPDELAVRLGTLCETIGRGGSENLNAAAGTLFASRGSKPRIGFLFSGQGTGTRLEAGGGSLASRFPAVSELLSAGAPGTATDTTDTAVVQPAIVAASAAALAVLRSLGIEATVGIGHSVGELTALHWAGAYGWQELMTLARARGRAMASCPGDPGTMASLAADASTAAALITGTAAVIAAYNAADRVVVSGPTAEIAALTRQAQARGVRVTRLPVSNAFHSPLMAPAAGPLGACLAALSTAPLARRVISTVTGRSLAADASVRELLLSQLTSPVVFADALAAAAAETDVLIEVGPGRALADLAAHGSAVPAFATTAGAAGLRGLLSAVGAAFVLGADVRWRVLARDRVHREGARRIPSLLANPCESVPPDDSVTSRPSPRPGAQPAAAPAPPAEPAGGERVRPAGGGPDSPADGADLLTTVRTLIAERIELPVEAVTADSRLLADLNLTSITVAQIAADVAVELGVRLPAAATELADASVSDLASVLADAGPDDDPDAAGGPSGVSSWVRAFRTQWEPQPRRGRPEPCGWNIAEGSGHVFDRAQAAFCGDQDGDQDRGSRRGLVVCVPSDLDDKCAHLLLEAARRVAADGASQRVAFLHHDGGAGGIARTLFLERPDLAVRVIALPPDASRDMLVAARAEAETGTGFAEVRLTEDGQRRAPRLTLCAVPPGDPRLGPADTLLATGGGKGIGAEAALALARVHGCRVAVLGRSPADDEEVAQNLRRFREARLTVRYLQADVTDEDSVRAAVTAVTEELGPVTAVLHAAGTNKPQLITELDEAMLDATVRPKVDGLRAILAAVDERRLRLLVAFGSIIGQAGMRGNADYALANEWLRLTVDLAAARLPGCRCLTIDWSVWAGAGMGDRLGLIESLLRMGVTPIGVDDGIAWLQRLVNAPRLPSALVVTGRFGQPPTVTLEQAELPMLRFLEDPLVHYPGVELVTEAKISPTTDPYLADHAVNGGMLMPAVLELEAMAQAAGAISGAGVTGFGRVEFSRPITIPADGTRRIRIAALRRESGEIDVMIRSDETSFSVDHARAEVRVGEHATRHSIPGPAAASPDAPAGLIDLGPQLYGPLLFHGPRFQRVIGYRQLRARRCVADVLTRPDAAWFSQYLPQNLILGDPGARDAFIHAAQACIPHRRVLPRAIDSVTVLRPPVGRMILTAQETYYDETTLRFDVTVVDEQGALCEIWEGLTLTMIEALPAPAAWPAELLGPYLERRLTEVLPGVVAAIAIDHCAGTTPGDPARSESALARALGRPTVLLHRGDGKPETGGEMTVTFSHDGPYTLAVAGQGPLGCDLETVASRDPSAWLALLGSARAAAAEHIARDCGQSLDEAATRLWVAAECARKAGCPPNETITIEADRGGGWVVVRVGRFRAATMTAHLRGTAQPLVIGVLAQGAP